MLYSDLIVAYQTNARRWLKFTREKIYVSWQGWNLLLTPVHDCIHDCIQDWNRKWDPALNMSTVQLNRHQGIIAMLSGGKVGWFFDQIRSEDKSGNSRVAPKGATPVFRSFPTFSGFNSPPF